MTQTLDSKFNKAQKASRTSVLLEQTIPPVGWPTLPTCLFASNSRQEGRICQNLLTILCQAGWRVQSRQSEATFSSRRLQTYSYVNLSTTLLTSDIRRLQQRGSCTSSQVTGTILGIIAVPAVHTAPLLPEALMLALQTRALRPSGHSSLTLRAVQLYRVIWSTLPIVDEAQMVKALFLHRLCKGVVQAIVSTASWAAAPAGPLLRMLL